MAFKAIIFCASAFFVQCALGQCLGRLNTPLAAAPCGMRNSLAYDSWAYDGLTGWPAGRLGCGPAVDIAAASSLNAAYGGGLPVASTSGAGPAGVAVASENVYEGIVDVAGNLPFLGTVAVEGVFPTMGVGAVSYGCGDGIVAITAEGPIASPAAIAPAMAPLGLAAAAPFGCASRGCGCGCGGPYRY